MKKSPDFLPPTGEVLPTRRLAAWQLTGLVATAVSLPSRTALAQGAAASLATQENISIKIELGRLARRTDTLRRRTIEDGAERPADAATRFKSEEAKISPELSTLFNDRISEDKWDPLVSARQVELAIALERLKVRLAPTSDEVAESIKRPLAEVKPAANEDIFNVLLTVLLDAFGVKELGKALVDLLLADAPVKTVIEQLRRALKAKHYGEAALELERLLATVVSPRVLQLIGSKFGQKELELVLKRVVVRFVPFIGWGYMATCLLVSIYHNRASIERML